MTRINSHLSNSPRATLFLFLTAVLMSGNIVISFADEVTLPENFKNWQLPKKIHSLQGVRSYKAEDRLAIQRAMAPADAVWVDYDFSQGHPLPVGPALVLHIPSNVSLAELDAHILPHFGNQLFKKLGVMNFFQIQPVRLFLMNAFVRGHGLNSDYEIFLYADVHNGQLTLKIGDYALQQLQTSKSKKREFLFESDKPMSTVDLDYLEKKFGNPVKFEKVLHSDGQTMGNVTWIVSAKDALHILDVETPSRLERQLLRRFQTSISPFDFGRSATFPDSRKMAALFRSSKNLVRLDGLNSFELSEEVYLTSSDGSRIVLPAGLPEPGVVEKLQRIAAIFSGLIANQIPASKVCAWRPNIFGVMKDEEEINFIIFEFLKNAVRHGHLLNLRYPIYLYWNLQADDNLLEIKVLDAAQSNRTLIEGVSQNYISEQLRLSGTDSSRWGGLERVRMKVGARSTHDLLIAVMDDDQQTRVGTAATIQIPLMKYDKRRKMRALPFENPQIPRQEASLFTQKEKDQIKNAPAEFQKSEGLFSVHQAGGTHNLETLTELRALLRLTAQADFLYKRTQSTRSDLLVLAAKNKAAFQQRVNLIFKKWANTRLSADMANDSLSQRIGLATYCHIFLSKNFEPYLTYETKDLIRALLEKNSDARIYGEAVDSAFDSADVRAALILLRDLLRHVQALQAFQPWTSFELAVFAVRVRNYLAKVPEVDDQAFLNLKNLLHDLNEFLIKSLKKQGMRQELIPEFLESHDLQKASKKD